MTFGSKNILAWPYLFLSCPLHQLCSFQNNLTKGHVKNNEAKV